MPGVRQGGGGGPHQGGDRAAQGAAGAGQGRAGHGGQQRGQQEELRGAHHGLEEVGSCTLDKGDPANTPSRIFSTQTIPLLLPSPC